MNESALYVNSDKQGEVSGWLSSDIAAGRDSALMDFHFIVKDSCSAEKVFMENTLAWNSADLLALSGDMSMYSRMRITDTVDWNVAAALSYANSTYSATARDLSQNNTQERFLMEANGDYGGGWYSW